MKNKSKITHCFHTLLAVLVSILSITGVSVAADTQGWDKTFSFDKLESFFKENLDK